MKYNIDHIYSTNNTFKVTIDDKGDKAMIREKGQNEATLRQGYRVLIDGKVASLGHWNKSKDETLCEVIKREHYAHLAYRELYYDLLTKLDSIGLVLKSDSEEYDDRF